LKGTGLEFAAKDETIAIRRKRSGVTRNQHDGAADSVADPSPGAGGDEQMVLEEVVVTAQHRVEKLQDVPMGISALSGETLDKLQARSFEDYVALVPGLSLQHNLPGSDILTLRGLNAGGAGATVSVYVDDAPFGSSSSIASSGAYSANFSPWDMQRIEVLRGPQGTLYGASSEGGLIKFVTNAPDPAKFSGVAEVTGEDVMRGGNGWSAKGVLNVPLGTLAAFRLSTSSEALPGYIDDPQLHKSDVNSGKKDGLRASLLLLPTSEISIRLTAFEQNFQLDGTPYVDIDKTRQLVYGNFKQRRAVSEPQRFEYQNYSLTTSWNVGWANALMVTSYGRSNDKSFFDLTYGSLGEVITQIPQLSGMPLGVGLTNHTDTRKLTQELRLQSQRAEKLEWEVGAYYTREASTVYQPFDIYHLPDGSIFNGVPGYLDRANIDTRYKEGAGFASVTYHLHPQVDVQVGGRWARNVQSLSKVEQQPILALLGVMPIDSVTTSHSAADKFLYSFAPRWHLTNDQMLYARIASGYQPGGPNILPFDAPPAVPTEFEPDTTVNYEAGIRSQLFDRRLSIDLTAFRIDWKRVQITVPLDGGQAQYIGNGGSATSQGLEWALGLRPLPDLTVALNGAYIDAKLTADAPTVGGVSGKRLPNSPQWSFSLTADYARHVLGSYRAFVGGTLSYVGAETNDFSSTGTTGIPPLREPGYITADLRLGLEGRPWRFSLFVKNVTNNQAMVLFAPPNAIYIQPRTIGVTASVKF
jgi:outer membrane receptor protein involved in Fe transport